MPQHCVIYRCLRSSRALCKCCNRELCLQHFWQHNDLIVSQLNTLKKEVDEVESRFQFLDIPRSDTTFRQQMKQWRIDSYTIIDRYYEQKCQEYSRFVKDKVDLQRGDITRIKKRINDFIDTEYGNQQDIDIIKLSVKDLNGKIQKLEQTSFPITILPLVIDQNLIQINH